MSATSEAITAIVAIGTPIGGAIAWLWNKLEQRFVGIEKALAECKEREVASQDRRAKRDTVIELLIQAIKHMHPESWSSPALEGAKIMLKELKDDEGNRAHD